MAVTRDIELARRTHYAFAWYSRDAFDRYTSSAPSWYYEIVAPGLSIILLISQLLLALFNSAG